MLLLPPFCIAGATMIDKIGNNISNIRMRNMLPYIRIAAIGIFGVISITMLITLNTNTTYYQALAFVLSNISGFQNLFLTRHLMLKTTTVRHHSRQTNT
jgi:Mg2+/citrate symporter